MTSKTTAGHLTALFTIVLWGTTFISTKVLLNAFQPVEILFFRFVLGLCALHLACPHRLRGTTPKQELTFMAAGLCGVCLYYLLENIALTHTLASNVGVITSTAPFFTAILSRFVTRGERLEWNFFVGFLVAMAGISLISFNGLQVRLNPTGDMLALAAAAVWACYAVLTKKIADFGHNTILTTRRVFLYGILLMLPSLFLFDFRLDLARFQEPAALFNIVFLGIGASALCFVTWNLAVRMLGAVKTSIYIYMMPVVTVATSVAVLDEQITTMSALGMALTLAGLVLSQGSMRKGRAGS